MIAKVLEYLAGKLRDFAFLIAIFVVVWIGAWIANGMAIAKFDLNALRDLFFYLMSKYSVDSVFNSPRGELPVVKPKEESNSGPK